MPAPTATIAGSAGFAGKQFFDVTAFIHDVQDVRRHANNKSSFVVQIYDGSHDPDTKTVKVMPLTIYFDDTLGSSGANSAGQPVSGESMKTLAEEHLHSKRAMSFFCISGAPDDTGNFSFRNTKHTFITSAVQPAHKCPLCGRVGNGGYALDGWNVGLICTGESVRYNCLSRLTNYTTPNQIVGEALEKVLGGELNMKYPCLALLVAPWVVNCDS